MRICVIFNPAARGEKARRFRHLLTEIGSQSELLSTTAPGDAQRLAAEAVHAGFTRIVAAGGDGTVNEVLNGIVSASGHQSNVCLGVLPLGTVNVFAREMGIPPRLQDAWRVALQGREEVIDLPSAEYLTSTGVGTRAFVQLAGAGLDARAIELVHWPLKKKIGPLAYVWAGIQAIAEQQPMISVRTPSESVQGELVLVGNGQLYGGPYRVFPNASLQDGLLELAVFPRANWVTLLRCAPHLLLRHKLPGGPVRMLRTNTVELSCSTGTVPIEVDGEWAGRLPATISIHPAALRVVVPAR